ncbi:hypothetical protein MNBD_UNCLBAC01-760 [hydrothermal vent metagenome]|uniref:CBS domain-containing protein n=1 Tax=hydrothermal vent metagenome TaxID=652676 RepID=A0A3B1E403_9ZZZZ
MKYKESHYVRELLNKITLEELMTKNPVMIEVDDPFHMVDEKMRQNNVRHLPVVDIDGKLVGIISQRDLYRTRAPRVRPDGSRYYEEEILDEFILAHCMTKNPFALYENNTLATAILEMSKTKYGAIPIIDDDKHVKGIMTAHDIIRKASEILKEG